VCAFTFFSPPSFPLPFSPFSSLDESRPPPSSHRDALPLFPFFFFFGHFVPDHSKRKRAESRPPFSRLSPCFPFPPFFSSPSVQTALKSSDCRKTHWKLEWMFARLPSFLFPLFPPLLGTFSPLPPLFSRDGADVKEEVGRTDPLKEALRYPHFFFSLPQGFLSFLFPFSAFSFCRKIALVSAPCCLFSLSSDTFSLSR